MLACQGSSFLISIVRSTRVSICAGGFQVERRFSFSCLGAMEGSAYL